jgi:hypothetical protein
MSLDPQRLSLLEDPTKAEAVSLLGRLSLAELARDVVRPCFESEGWRQLPETSSAQGERLLLTTTKPSGRYFIRVWLDSEGSLSDPLSLLDRIREIARQEHAQRFTDDEVPLLTFLWILPNSLPVGTKTLLRRGLEDDTSLRGPVEILDLDALYVRLVEDGIVRSITPLRLIHARHEAVRHRKNGEGVFAAHWFYRAFRLYLQQSPDGLNRALESLEQGLEALEHDAQRGLHPYRMLRRVFRAWIILLRHRPSIFKRPVRNSLDELPEKAIAAALDRLEPGHPRLDWLLVDFDSMFRQLELLAKGYVDTPAGLSTLQICRLLLRAGFPPTEPGIENRLQRVLKDLRQEKGKSIDVECSLCTGTVVSIFSLARRRDEVEKAKKWLTSTKLHELRYSTIASMPKDVGKGEHALHYAASVLQGLLDFGEGRSEDLLGPVLEIFFWKTDRDDRGFFPEWIRHSNIERFEVYRYILSAFLRYHLMRLTLPKPWEEMLRQAVRALIHALDEEGRGLHKLYLYYPVRMNLSSLALGLLLDAGKEAKELARQVTGYLRRRPEASGKRRGQLWDSNVDRNVVLLDSYLDYWETLFALEERGMPIAEFLPDEAPPPTGSVGHAPTA